MTSTAVNKSAAISKTAAGLAMGTIVSYQILLIVLIFLRTAGLCQGHFLSQQRATGPCL
jgi:hypothetical protein